MVWTVETLNATVDKELEALPADMRARFVRIGELITAVGLDRIGAPHIKPLTGPMIEQPNGCKFGLRLLSHPGFPC